MKHGTCLESSGMGEELIGEHYFSNPPDEYGLLTGPGPARFAKPMVAERV